MKPLLIAAALTMAPALAFAAQDHGDHHPGQHPVEHEHKTPGENAPNKKVATKAAVSGPGAEKINAAIEAGGDLIAVDVLGVVCDFCAIAMNKTVGARAEVAATAVDLDRKTLTIVTKPGAGLSDDEITSLVTKAGYKVSKIRRGEAALSPDTAEAEHKDHG